MLTFEGAQVQGAQAIVDKLKVCEQSETKSRFPFDGGRDTSSHSLCILLSYTYFLASL